ncbi:MAG: NfeD family protein [Vulcanimicrobiaceae bacterium]
MVLRPVRLLLAATAVLLGAFALLGAAPSSLVASPAASPAGAFLRVASGPEIGGLLLAIGFVGLLFEMLTLGGVAAAIGVAALALFFGLHLIAGTAGVAVALLAAVGVAGILIELHVLPGHGYAGLLGLVALLAASALSFGFALFLAAQALSIAIVLTAATFFVSSRLLPENAFFRRIALGATQGPEYVSSSDFSSLLGREGVAASFLRPAGVATIDGLRVDVLTEGDFVPAGTPIWVARIEGARIFVEPLAKES